MPMTPEQFVADFKPRWEGGMSVNPNDAGNWSTGTKGVGVLIGSNHGITGRVLAAHRGVPIGAITQNVMKALTAKEAADIAVGMFYKQPKLDSLVWNRVTASIFDFGYNAGPTASIRLLQDMLDVGADGKLSAGGETAKAYEAFVKKHGEEFTAGAWWAKREEFYEDLVTRRPSDVMYLKGWDNRSDYYTPGHTEGWWKRFG